MPSATTSNYLFNAQMDQLLSNTAFTPPANIYVALMTVTPQLDNTGGSEVSTAGTGYVRQGIAAGGWSGAVGSDQQYSNSSDITFPVPTADWGSIVSAALYDSETGGNLLFTAQLTQNKSVVNGDGAPKILAGQLRISRATC